MSYLVLARKWRPRSFHELVGQEHVVRALANALDHQRLHHAYLFTGTRGVGKTTIARIFAKSLNCERGVSSQPCGVCSACTEIDAGRFVDLLEVDAASNTGVDDVREIIDNAQYAPVRGHFKVYLIDEVHMLSKPAFNALLKTLEEPPPHVKFLLATTDPQKLPVTVLSRCLQFNLKRLPADLIGGHLRRVLEAEAVPFDAGAVDLVARAADGSLRDALSLLDQAIGFGGGTVHEAEVRAMLGTVARERVCDLLDAVAAGDGAAVLGIVETLAESAPDFADVLAELLAALHEVAVVQVVAPAGAADAVAARLAALAVRLPPEDVQLFYQIGVLGQRDLPYAPDPRSGLEMVLLRMLAFRPAAEAAAPPAARTASPATPGAAAPRAEPGRAAPSAAAPRGTGSAPSGTGSAPSGTGSAPSGTGSAPASAGAAPAGTGPASPATALDFADWHAVVERLGLGGVALQLARNCVVSAWDGQALALSLDPVHAHLLGSLAENRLREAIGRVAGRPVALRIAAGALPDETPAQRAVRNDAERRAAAVGTMREDEVVQALGERFDARLLEDTVLPLGDPAGGGAGK